MLLSHNVTDVTFHPVRCDLGGLLALFLVTDVSVDGVRFHTHGLTLLFHSAHCHDWRSFVSCVGIFLKENL